MLTKKIVLTFLLFYAGIVSAGGYTCAEEAQIAVEIREDYKNYDEVLADFKVTRLRLMYAQEAGSPTADANYQNTMKELIARIVFHHSNGAKGKKLYKFVYDNCTADEKSTADRAAKQAARQKQ